MLREDIEEKNPFIRSEEHRIEQLVSMEQFEKTFRDAIQMMLGDKGRLVVFVDDLDRPPRSRPFFCSACKRRDVGTLVDQPPEVCAPGSDVDLSRRTRRGQETSVIQRPELGTNERLYQPGRCGCPGRGGGGANRMSSERRLEMLWIGWAGCPTTSTASFPSPYAIRSPFAIVQYQRFLKADDYANPGLWRGFHKFDEESRPVKGDWGDEGWQWYQDPKD